MKKYKIEKISELDEFLRKKFSCPYGEYLSELYDFQYGTGNTIENIGGDYPIYGSNGIVGYTNKFNSEDAPVIGHIGAYAGIVNWAMGKHYVTYNGVICKIRQNINRQFGYYALLNSNPQNKLRGSTQPFISYDLLNEVKTYLPDRKIQGWRDCEDRWKIISKGFQFKPLTNVLDLGSHYGYFSKKIAELDDRIFVLSVEGAKERAEIQRQMLAENKIENVYLCQKQIQLIV